jgi:hypothetical protein
VQASACLSVYKQRLRDFTFKGPENDIRRQVGERSAPAAEAAPAMTDGRRETLSLVAAKSWAKLRIAFWEVTSQVMV